PTSNNRLALRIVAPVVPEGLVSIIVAALGWARLFVIANRRGGIGLRLDTGLHRRILSGRRAAGRVTRSRLSITNGRRRVRLHLRHRLSTLCLQVLGL